MNRVFIHSDAYRISPNEIAHTAVTTAAHSCCNLTTPHTLHISCNCMPYRHQSSQSFLTLEMSPGSSNVCHYVKKAT